jgi:hypothetical protein
MLADGLIEQAESRPPPELDDERRRYHRLTAEGRNALRAEVQRCARVFAVAQNRNLLASA